MSLRVNSNVVPTFALSRPIERLHAAGVDRQIVLARVGGDLDERLDARRQLVAGAQLRADTVVVAVGVARRSCPSVESRSLVDGAVGRCP